MSELRKANSDNPFFVTLTVVGWIDVFIRSEYNDEIIKNLEYCRKAKGLKIYAYCIMSSHIHMIIANDEGRLADILRDFKSYSAKRMLEMITNNPQESRKEWLLYMFEFFAKSSIQNKQYQFWQKTSHPTELITNAVFQQKMDYIHRNPVAAMMVNDEATFVYSSANPDSPLIVDES
ncbi:REP-associated tyrosine transposase [Mucilaginibacter boryungensis]|uniref:Transposase n=1 Tax=Mucilaginibacter boryungensis TaxID=768480 RepID=A0ABR9XFI6_9SPHI|nr:transposase [Mucilaginibacter boryungensis]MBE9665932.1 transposase [Mucilaginibacter boryungensis]